MSVPSGISNNVGAEAAEMSLVYELDMLSVPAGGFTRGYTADNSACAASMTFSRIAYYVEIVDAAGLHNWVYVSMDAFTTNATRIGIPTPDGTLALNVANVNVVGNAPSFTLLNGTGVQGNIEFWDCTSSPGQAYGIPGASDDLYDIGDTPTSCPGAGSFQVHVWSPVQQTVFGFNHWGLTGGNQVSVGIGTSPEVNSGIDWSFNYPSSYTSAKLYAFISNATAGSVCDSALTTLPSRVAGALAGAAGVGDEVARLQRVYSVDMLAVPTGGLSGQAVPYVSNNVGCTKSLRVQRIAYFMEIMVGSQYNYVYVSMDPFTNPANIGIPLPSHNQAQDITNVTVIGYAPNFAVLNGTGLQGNVEMWSCSYSTANTYGIPGASDTLYDIGDVPTSCPGYGSFQVHTWAPTQQTVFAFNRWGQFGGNQVALGIGTAAEVSGGVDWTFASPVPDNYVFARVHAFVVPYPSLTEAQALPGRIATVLSAAGVLEAPDLQLVYALDMLSIDALGVSSGLAAGSSPYVIDNSDGDYSFSRVAYFMEIVSGSNTYNWVYVSMDAWSSLVEDIGIPEVSRIFVNNVTNVNVVGYAPAFTLLNGTGLNGNIEFYDCSYSPTNYYHIRGGDDSVFDIGDEPTTCPGDGSFQVNTWAPRQQTALAFNHWGQTGGANAAVGIGSSPNYYGDTDWTAEYPNTYNSARLYAFVYSDVAQSEICAASLTPPDHITARLSTIPELSSEVEDLQLVYSLDMLNVPLAGVTSLPAPPYRVDNYNCLGSPDHARVAYYFEIMVGDQYNWVYVSADPFTNIPNIGIPSYSLNQAQDLTNVNVFGYAPSFTLLNGTGLQGNVEFWNCNYAPTNAYEIPGATDDDFDMGDVPAGCPGYGSFQVHTWAPVLQTVFGFNNWGSAGGPNVGVGIGPSASDSGSLDWTFSTPVPDTYSAAVVYMLIASPPTCDATATAVPGRIAALLDDVGVLEAAQLQLVYALDMLAVPPDGMSSPAAVPYMADNHACIDAFTRVAYFMEIVTTTNQYNWVYVSMDAWTSNVENIGIPPVPVIQASAVTNVNVVGYAPAFAVFNGTDLQGNIEFWDCTYTAPNAYGVPGASDTLLDIGDDPSGCPGYGSFQVHTWEPVQQTVFGFNHWGQTGGLDISAGIGVSPDVSDATDWSNNNPVNYNTARLYAFVTTGTSPDVCAAALAAPSHITDVLAGVADLADEVAALQYVYSLDMLNIPAAGISSLPNDNIPYLVDNAACVTTDLGRVAYFMEITTASGRYNWVFASMNTFTASLAATGIPTPSASVIANVTSVTVVGYAPDFQLVNGTGLRGNLENWACSYTAANANHIPGASNTLLDIGDTPTDCPGLGSFQLHTWNPTQQTVLAFNNWGQAGGSEVAIGIGTSPPVDSATDWTNSYPNTYTRAVLHVFVEAPTTPSRTPSPSVPASASPSASASQPASASPSTSGPTSTTPSPSRSQPASTTQTPTRSQPPTPSETPSPSATPSQTSSHTQPASTSSSATSTETPAASPLPSATPTPSTSSPASASTTLSTSLSPTRSSSATASTTSTRSSTASTTPHASSSPSPSHTPAASCSLTPSSSEPPSISGSVSLSPSATNPGCVNSGLQSGWSFYPGQSVSIPMTLCATRTTATVVTFSLSGNVARNVDYVVVNQPTGTPQIVIAAGSLTGTLVAMANNNATVGHLDVYLTGSTVPVVGATFATIQLLANQPSVTPTATGSRSVTASTTSSCTPVPSPSLSRTPSLSRSTTNTRSATLSSSSSRTNSLSRTSVASLTPSRTPSNSPTFALVSVALSSASLTIGQSAVLTATLNATLDQQVSVSFEFSGTAARNTHYVTSPSPGSTLLIAPGQLNGTYTLTETQAPSSPLTISIYVVAATHATLQGYQYFAVTLN